MIMAAANKDAEKNEVISIDHQKTMDRVNRKSLGYKNRSATDKYWSILFFFIFIIWISSWYYACHYPKSYFKIESANTISIDNANELAPFYLWGHSWLFDALTCNLAFLEVHYENSGSIVIWTNALFSILLLVYSISSMPNNNMFHSQLTKAFIIFIILRLYLCFLVPIYWLLPEAIFMIIWYTKKSYTDDLLKYYHDDMCYFREYYWLLIKCIAIPLLSYGYLTLRISHIVYELGWDNILSYVIVGGSIYVGLTIFYLWLLVISCTVDREMDYESKDHRSRIVSIQFFYALAIVLRYHFGTACYHATLILPRLATLYVMNEPEFKKDEKFSKITQRFHAAQYQVHNLTLMSTAVGGTSHSESLRELLRYFASGLKPRLEHFQCFSQIARSLTALLMATNSLTLIFLWANGQDNSHLSLATWMFYPRLMFIFYLMMKICDAIFNPILLHLKHAPFTSADLVKYLLSGGEQRGPII